MIKEDPDSTIRSFLSLKKEVEKVEKAWEHHPILNRFNIKEKAPATTEGIK